MHNPFWCVQCRHLYDGAIWHKICICGKLLSVSAWLWRWWMVSASEKRQTAPKIKKNLLQRQDPWKWLMIGVYWRHLCNYLSIYVESQLLSSYVEWSRGESKLREGAQPVILRNHLSKTTYFSLIRWNDVEQKVLWICINARYVVFVRGHFCQIRQSLFVAYQQRASMLPFLF